MRKLLIFSLVSILFILGFILYPNKKEIKESKEEERTESRVKIEKEKIMTVSSPAFKNNKPIPAKYTCDGENISPPLEFVSIPKDARSLVLIVDDPDAPSKTWVHWVVYNINPSTEKVEENSIPKGGVQGMTDFGQEGYGGPCPPSGTHRYFFKLYALPMMLDVPEGLTKRQILEKMNDLTIEEAELVALYKRK